jgi:hypothetical protein
LEAAGTQEPQYVCCIFFKYLMQWTLLSCGDSQCQLLSF